MKHDHGIPAAELGGDDLERELRHLWATREDTFFSGSEDALATHTDRMLELEREYMRRFPDRVKPDADRTREGARTRAGQRP